MIKKLFKILVHLAIGAVLFILLVWGLMGLTPTQSTQMIRDQIHGYIYGTKTFSRSIKDTASSMSDVANHHLKEAAERIDGKDPYQDFNPATDRRLNQ